MAKLIAAQVILFIVISPAISGIITKIKNNIRMRRGPGILQPYYNLVKLFSKGEVVSKDASWIFTSAPYVVLSSSLAAAVLIPVFIAPTPAKYAGDLLALVFIFSLGRFFMALAALDAGSAFGGMGSSREMFISSLVEPVVCLAALAISLGFGSTAIPAFSGMHTVTVSALVAGVSLFLVALAETSRIPVDNQETHLELTMIHEAMVLEYSGKPLALIELSSYIRQMVWFYLIAAIIFPSSAPSWGGPVQSAVWLSWYVARIVIIAAAVALVEVSVAKMRLFRAADFLGFAFVLAVISTVFAVIGV